VVRNSETGSEQDMIRVGGVVPVKNLWSRETAERFSALTEHVEPRFPETRRLVYRLSADFGRFDDV